MAGEIGEAALAVPQGKRRKWASGRSEEEARALVLSNSEIGEVTQSPVDGLATILARPFAGLLALGKKKGIEPDNGAKLLTVRRHRRASLEEQALELSMERKQLQRSCQRCAALGWLFDRLMRWSVGAWLARGRKCPTQYVEVVQTVDHNMYDETPLPAIQKAFTHALNPMNDKGRRAHAIASVARSLAPARTTSVTQLFFIRAQWVVLAKFVLGLQ